MSEVTETMILETPRLIIRELLPSDGQGMFAMDCDPEVHRYLGSRPCTDIQQSLENIANIRQQYKDNGIGRWAVALKNKGQFIGWTGFKRMRESENGHVNHLDFGYRYARRFWGQGYAFEAAKAALDYGIEKLGFREVYATTDVDNRGSKRILEKLGFRFMEIFHYDAPTSWGALPGEPATWYQLDS